MTNYDQLIKNANLHIDRHEYKEAEKQFQQIITKDPNNIGALNGLAVINIHQQKNDMAIAFLEKAILIDPSAAHLYYNMSICYHAQNKTNEALTHCAKALKLHSNYSDAQHFFIRLCQEKATQLANTEQWQDALNTLNHVLSLPHHLLTADIYYQLGFYNEKRQQFSQAKQYWEKTLSLSPHHAQANFALDNLHRTNIPNWHLPMMNDAVRNKGFQNAIEKIVNAETTVLDIGAGSGLMSMIAARAGAKKVYACEEVELIADKAIDIIHANGFTDKQITLIKKRSTHITIPDDIPHKVDVIVTETFGTGLIEEHCLSTIDHAVKHLLKPGGSIIPQGAALYLCLIESEAIYQLHHVQQITGFDLSAFNEFSEAPKGMWSGHVNHYPYKIISDIQTIEKFDFYNQTPLFDEKELILTAHYQGAGHALCMWFDIFLDDTEVITTNPTANETIQAKSWGQRIQTLSTPILVKKGERINIKVRNVNNFIGVALM